MDMLLFQQKKQNESTYTAAFPDLQKQMLIHNQRLAEHLLSVTLFLS